MCTSAKWMTILIVLAITGCAGRWNATPLSFVPTAINAGFVVGFAIEPPAGPAHIIRWSADGTPTLLDNLISIFSDPHILNNGAVFWMNGGSIIRNLGGTSTFQQPP